MVNKMGQILDRIIERASLICLLFSGVVILLIAVATSYGVVTRYAIGQPQPYSYEISTIFVVASCNFAIAAVQMLRRNLRVDFVTNYFSQVTQDILLNIVGPILALLYVAVMVWQGWVAAWYSLQINELSWSAWRIPLYPTKFIVPVGTGLLCLVLLAQLCRGVISLKGRKTR